MNRVLIAALVVPVLFTAGFRAEETVEFASAFDKTNDRVWAGEDYWANPMEDWRVEGGWLECLFGAPNRNVYLLTHEVGDGTGGFTMGVDFRVPETGRNKGTLGFRVGMRPQFWDYRSAALSGSGIPVGVTGDAKLFIGKKTFDLDRLPPAGRLVVTAIPAASGKMILRVVLSSDGKETGSGEVSGIAAAEVTGGVALVLNHPEVVGKKVKSGLRCAFRKWTLSGARVRAFPERAFGPVLWTMHTLSRSADGAVLKMTVQMPPLGEKDPHEVALQVRKEEKWTTLVKGEIEPLSRTAVFRVDPWDDSKDVPYRALYVDAAGKEREWAGTVRKNPVDREKLVVAAFTGNQDYGFPHADIVEHVKVHRPDLMVFTGDQLYELTGGFGCPRNPLDRAAVGYLRKWALYGWEYRELLRDIPVLNLPDDHDVYHGNIWGMGGKKAVGSKEMRDQDSGGYKMPAEFVRMVERTQTAHHPDPYDPTPVLQGIGVYYGSMCYGGISFAVIEDRKFKSSPSVVVPKGKIVNGWARNPDYDAAREGDVGGAVLLGERQLKFLDAWTADWSGGAWMKVLLSQTVFSNVATMPVAFRSDSKTPGLPILKPGEYAPEEWLVADHDSNGWPQTGRNEALRRIRKGFALHICGDQHLGNTIRYGVDDWEDAGYCLTVPAVANIWPRRWYPPEPGENHRKGAPRYTGRYRDGFGNRMTVLSVNNPTQVEMEPKWLYSRAPGYGIAVFERKTRRITVSVWPRWVDPAGEDAKPFPGWPITFAQEDNYARKAVAWLPTLRISGRKDPVVQVVDDKTGEMQYALRIAGNEWRPGVFSSDPHTIRVGDPDAGVWKVFKGLTPGPVDSEATIEVVFE